MPHCFECNAPSGFGHKATCTEYHKELKQIEPSNTYTGDLRAALRAYAVFKANNAEVTICNMSQLLDALHRQVDTAIDNLLATEG